MVLIPPIVGSHVGRDGPSDRFVPLGSNLCSLLDGCCPARDSPETTRAVPLLLSELKPRSLAAKQRVASERFRAPHFNGLLTDYRDETSRAKCPICYTMMLLGHEGRVRRVGMRPIAVELPDRHKIHETLENRE